MTVDPAPTVTSVAAGVSATQPYTSPTTAERVSAGTGLARLVIGDLAGAATLFEPLGFTITTDLDPETGRRYAMAVSETTTPRAWGLYLVDLSNPLRLCIAVPHPKFDANCEQLALRLWRATPARCWRWRQFTAAQRPKPPTTPRTSTRCSTTSGPP